MSTRVTTAVYLAPEVALANTGEQESETLYGTSVDIWAFGVVLFQVLSGKHLVPEYDGDLTKVIGFIIRRVGSDVSEMAASAMYQSAVSFSEECSVRATVPGQRLALGEGRAALEVHGAVVSQASGSEAMGRA